MRLAIAVLMMLGASSVDAGAQEKAARQASASRPKQGTAGVDASPGSIVRWSVPGTKRCAMGKRSWDALQETCYYPVDLQQKPGVVRVSRHGADPARTRGSPCCPYFGARRDHPRRHSSGEAFTRRSSANAREQARVARLWVKREGPARFTLPLAAPAKTLPEGKGFGATWVFNNPPGTSELHSGADYAIPVDTALSAVADGTVVSQRISSLPAMPSSSTTATA